jgi:hypothetical protein
MKAAVTAALDECLARRLPATIARLCSGSSEDTEGIWGLGTASYGVPGVPGAARLLLPPPPPEDLKGAALIGLPRTGIFTFKEMFACTFCSRSRSRSASPAS